MSHRQVERFAISEEAIAELNEIAQRFGETMEKVAAAFSEWFDTTVRPIVEEMAFTGGGIVIERGRYAGPMTVHRGEIITPGYVSDLAVSQMRVAKRKIEALRDELKLIKQHPIPSTVKRRQQIERALWLWSLSFYGTPAYRRGAQKELMKEFGINGWWSR